MPSCSGGVLSWSCSWATCGLTKFKACIRSQPQKTARSKTKPHKAGEPLALTPRHELSGASSEGWRSGLGWRALQATSKMVIGKWYQKVSKHFKKLLKTATCGRCTKQDRPDPVGLPSVPEVCPGGQDAASSPLKTVRDSEDVQAMAGTAPPGLGPVV